jgi:acyl-CoA thioesterase FadM
MLHSFALAKALLSASKRSSDVLAPVRQNLRAWPWLCDHLGHVNNARYLDLLSLGRAEWLANAGLLRPVIFNGYSFIVGGINAVYRRQIPRMALFSMETRVAGFDDRWSYHEHTFHLQHDQRGKIAARFLTSGQLFHRGAMVSPLDVMRRFGVDVPAEPAWSTSLEAWSQAQRVLLDSINEHDRRL